MIAFFVAYIIVGLVIWAGVIAEIISNGHRFVMSDSYGLPLTMAALATLWPAAIANWQIKEWKNQRNG